MRNLAIIPARGGSKRIPRKNIKDFLGKPIIAYSIEAALTSNLFDEVMVSTDDREIASVAEKYGASVPFLRSAATANDYATTVDVLVEVLERYSSMGKNFDNACCIYATAPFITCSDLCAGYSQLESDGLDSIFTVTEFSYPIWRGLHKVGNRIEMIWPEYKSSRSQDLEKAYHDAGQFYIFRVQRFLETRTMWGDNTGALILPEIRVQDLDTESDWQMAELKYKFLNDA